MSYEDTNDQKNYEVGYRKPPKSGQFRKGQSGNRRGSSEVVRARKAKASTFGNLFSEGMQRPVEVEEGGKTVVLTRMHLGIRRRVEEAAKGNIGALKEILKLRDVKDTGPLAPGKPLVLTVDELRAVGPPGVSLYRPDVVIIREPKPRGPGETARRTSQGDKPHLPRRSARELIEIEFERRIQVTDAASGTSKRMTMREVIAEQLMRLFTAGKPGATDLMIRLNKRLAVDADEISKVYIHVPWDFEMPPKLPPNWQETMRAAGRTRPLVTEAPAVDDEDMPNS